MRHATFLTALVATSVAPTTQAQEAPPADWTIAKLEAGCEARFPVLTLDDTAIVLRQSLRANREPALMVRGKLPWQPVVSEDKVPPRLASAQVFWNDSEEAVGAGTVFNRTRHLSGYTEEDLIFLNDAAKATFADRVPAGADLVIKSRDTTIARIPVGGVSTADVDLTECVAEVGQELMNARPEGETAGSGARGPVPRTSPGNWVTSDDYPSRALRQGLQGTTRYQATVSPFGFITDCRIIATSGSPVLDTATCRLIERRARFYPARDEQDQATEATIAQDVVWRLP